MKKSDKNEWLFIAAIWVVIAALYLIPLEIRRNPASQFLGVILLLGLGCWFYFRIKDAAKQRDPMEAKNRLNDLYLFCAVIAVLGLILLISEAVSPGITRRP